MSSKLRLAGVFGAMLVLLGGAGFASGSIMQAEDDCVSGTVLDIEPVDENETADLQGNTTAFANLSLVEQRIFLEAYTEGTAGSGVSDRYENWSESWFDETGAYDEKHSPLYVTYRGSYYEAIGGAVDCGLSIGPFVRIGGILGLLLGGSILGAAGVWQMRETNR